MQVNSRSAQCFSCGHPACTHAACQIWHAPRTMTSISAVSHAGPVRPQHRDRCRVRGATARYDPFDLASWLLIAALLAVALLDIPRLRDLQRRRGPAPLRRVDPGLLHQRLDRPLGVRIQEPLSLWRAVRHRRGAARPASCRLDIFVIRHVLCAHHRHRRHRRGLGHRAADRGPARRPARRGRAGGLRPLVRLDVQPHQGHPVRRRDDGRDLFPAARGARPAAPAPAASAAVRAAARRRARAARAGAADAVLCSDRDRAASAAAGHAGERRAISVPVAAAVRAGASRSAI